MANLDLAGIITRVCTDLRSKFSKVSVTPTLTSGTKSATVTVDGTDYDLYAPASYELPPATASTLGGVKVGDGLSVASDGTLSSTGMVVLEYGKSTWLECLEACEANRVVYCKVPSNSTNSRMAFLAWRESSKFEFQYYRSVSTHTATQQGDEVYTYVLNRGDAVTGFWTTTTRQAYTRVVAGDGLSSTYDSGVLTLSLDPASSGGLLVTCYGGGNNIAMDKTAQDIYDALSAGVMPVFRSTLTGSATNGFTSLSRANFDTTPITITLANGAQQYEAASMSDYPRIDTGGSN